MTRTVQDLRIYREELVHERRRAAYRKDAALLAGLHNAIAALDEVIAEGMDEEPLDVDAITASFGTR